MSDDRRDSAAERADAATEQGEGALWRKIDRLGALGSEREAGWRRFYAKLHNRLQQLLKRIRIQDETIERQGRSIARLEKRAEKQRERLVTSRERIDALEAELATRLPRAQVRMKLGRTALIAFEAEEAQAAGPAREEDDARDALPPDSAADMAVPETAATPVGGAGGDAPAPELSAEEEQARDIRRLLPMPAIGVSNPGIGRVAFYSAVAGDYDLVGEPEIVDARADYFLFTDKPMPSSSVWQTRPFDYRHADNTRTARYVKLHPHVYFADYDWAIWLDANLRPAAVAEAFVANHRDDDIVAWRHPHRDCVYDEAAECLELGKDDPAVIEAHLERLREQGYPRHAGLIESSVLVINHRRPRVAALLDDWWRALDSGSKRDQLSFNPTLAAHPDVRLGHLAERGTNSRNDPRIVYAHHRGSDARTMDV